jgi:hypothetical protein
MGSCHRQWAWIAIACVPMLLGSEAIAQTTSAKQSPSPLKASAKTNVKPAAKASAASSPDAAAKPADEDETAQNKAGDGKKAKESPAPNAPSSLLPKPEEYAATPEERAVNAILQNNPSTPLELVRSAKLLANMHRPDLGKKMLERVLSGNLKPESLAQLANQLGSATIVEISSRRDLAPEGRQLADALLTATEKQQQDPAYIDGLIKKLSDPSSEVRVEAITGLQAARGAAVPPLMAVLADPAKAAQHAAARTAIVQLGLDALPPLVAALDAPDPKLAAQTVEILGLLPSSDVKVYLAPLAVRDDVATEVRAAAIQAVRSLLGSVPAKSEVAEMSIHEAKQYFERRRRSPENAAGRSVVWSYDAASRRIVATSTSPDVAALRLAIRFARDAHAVMPSDAQGLRLYLATMMEEAAYRKGVDKPVGVEDDAALQRLSEFTPETLDRVLDYAMRTNHAPAAAVAAKLMGRNPQTIRILARGNAPAALVMATRHGDRRLRLAAVEALVAVRPKQTYHGASFVLESIGFLISSAGDRRAIVACAHGDHAPRMAGYLAQQGFVVDRSPDGRGLLQHLLNSADFEVALIDAGIDHPTIEFLLQEMRHDGRTSQLPVAIMARPDLLERSRRLARQDDAAEAFSYPYDDAAAKWQVEHSLTLAKSAVPAAERLKQAGMALDWLAELMADRSQRYYDFQRIQKPVLAAVDISALKTRAVKSLALFGTAESQKALIAMADRATEPVPSRIAAVEAFRQATQRFGILLTTDQIQQQYDLFNASKGLDAETRRVLGLILDCIEAPTQSTRQAKNDLKR